MDPDIVLWVKDVFRVKAAVELGDVDFERRDLVAVRLARLYLLYGVS